MKDFNWRKYAPFWGTTKNSFKVPEEKRINGQKRSSDRLHSLRRNNENHRHNPNKDIERGLIGRTPIDGPQYDNFLAYNEFAPETDYVTGIEAMVPDSNSEILHNRLSELSKTYNISIQEAATEFFEDEKFDVNTQDLILEALINGKDAKVKALEVVAIAKLYNQGIAYTLREVLENGVGETQIEFASKVEKAYRNGKDSKVYLSGVKFNKETEYKMVF